MHPLKAFWLFRSRSTAGAADTGRAASTCAAVARNRRHLARLERTSQARASAEPVRRRPRSWPASRSRRCVQYASLGGISMTTRPPVPGRHVLVVDICGHGCQPASGMIKSAFMPARRWLMHARGGADRRCAAAGHRRFVTLFCGRIPAPGGPLEYANAGHPPGLLRRANVTVARVGATGTIVCDDLPGQIWTRETVSFHPGDQLLLYTDGVTESEGAEGQLGISRLEQLASQSTERDGALLVRILQYAHEYAAGQPAFDDLTLMVAGI